MLRVTRARAVLVWVVLVLACLGLAGNLYHLQVQEAGFLKARARMQQQITFPAMTKRRPIQDAQGETLALDQPVFTLYAHPIQFNHISRHAMAVALAPLIHQPVAALEALLGTAPTGIRVADDLTPQVADQIKALYQDGLELEPHDYRFYPQQDLFAEVVGFVNQAMQGQAGVEYSQESLIAYEQRPFSIYRTGEGYTLPENLRERRDLTLKLTLDGRLQRVAQTALAQQVLKDKADRGAAIVMDAHTGALLTLVTSPTYNPNKYYDAPYNLFKDWAVADLYEPGSTIKPLNLSIALTLGVIKPDSIIDDPGKIMVGGWPIEDFEYSTSGGMGPISVTKVLEYSSNVGMARIMLRLPPRVYYHWLERLGLGKPVTTDLPFAAASYLTDINTFANYPIEPATAAFGQGLSLTPLQLVQLHGIIASGGLLLEPHVVDGLYNPDGEKVWPLQTISAPRIFAPEITHQVLEMMEAVVQRGTGVPAQIPGYRIGGKTGTAQIPDPQGGYYHGRTIDSFIGILPVENPRYVVAVVVENPQSPDAFGATVAAPVAKTIMEALLTLQAIPPSQPIPTLSPSP